MKPVTLSILICCGLLGSCYKPYTANLEADEKILVVEGMITNEVASYHVRLSYASPFYSNGSRQPVNSARVYVTDEKDIYYPFRELKNGYYISDSLKFTGHSGSTYTLNIAAPDGDIYRSDPQQLFPVFYLDNIYAEPGSREMLSRFNGQVVLSQGANIMIDIRNQEKVLPGFRINANLVRQYFYALFIPPPAFDPPLYSFYCWQTDNANSNINLTKKGYSSGSSDLIKKHEVYFVEDQLYFFGKVYGLGPRQQDLSYIALPSTERQSYVVKHRILYLNLYALNNDTYFYYKSMDEQLRSEGKLFDPIAVQLDGNISCVTNHDKKVIGFFEASSVSRSSYIVDFRNPSNNQYSLRKLPYVLPPVPDGCWIEKVPPFWIY
jgi:hypothetical protein